MISVFSNPPLGLSRKATESFKIALSITVAMGVALYMDWEQPRWAAINIALASLATVGQSLNNMIERVFGTLSAGLMTLLLVALFGQDRWLYMIALSVWMGVCTYMMGGKKWEGFWMLAGFATAIIATEAGIHLTASSDSFEFVMLRLQQTLLGLLVYIVVMVLVWPHDGYAEFKGVNRKLHDMQHRLFGIYITLMHDRLQDADKAAAAAKLRMQALQLQTQFLMLLEAVPKERYEVWEIRGKWEHYGGQLVTLGEKLAIWRESFAEVQALDLDKLLPDLPAFTREIDARLTQLGRMLNDEPPTATPQSVELTPNAPDLDGLSAFQKASLTVFIQNLQALEPLTRSMVETLGDIKDFTPAPAAVVEETRAAPGPIVPDVDRLLGSFRVVLTLWMSYGLLIWFNPIPGGSNLVSMGAASAMAIALMPHLPIRTFMPALTGCLIFSALVFLFVLPLLTSYWSLGALIFVVCFGIVYLYFEPQKMLFKGLGIVVFLTLLDISSQQNFGFIRILDNSVMFYLIALILAINSNIPFNPRPEKAFLRLVRRYFRSAEYLISTLRRDPSEQATWFVRWKKAFYANQLALVPGKLAIWGNFLKDDALGETSRAQVQTLTLNLQALSYRLRELLEARSSIDSQRLVNELQVQELQQSIRAWQERIQETFQILSIEPTTGRSEKFRAGLTEIVESLEASIKEALNRSAKDRLASRDGENVYRLLGTYRSVSEAMGDYVTSTDAVHWSRWKEERF